MTNSFNKDYFSCLASLEADNFWFRCRNMILLWVFARFCGKAKNFLEIGCGTGFVISAVVKRFPGISAVGSDLFVEGLEFARQRVPRAKFYQLDALDLPYCGEFDCIGAFDVLEHVVDDSTVVKQVYNSLTPNGLFLVTVPQHRWLWSDVDEASCHKRRYSLQCLSKLLTDSGFEIVYTTSFMSVLLPVMYLNRFFLKHNRNKDDALFSELRINRLLNQILFFASLIDVKLIQLGIRLPLGGSRLVVCKKK